MGEEADYYFQKLENRLLQPRQPRRIKQDLTFTWTCLNGTRLRPEDMTTKHIHNILACKTLACGELPRDVKRIFLGELALRGQDDN